METKKLIFSFAVIALSITACQDNSDELTPNQEIASVDMSDFYVYTDDDSIAAKGTNNSHGDKCYSMKVLNRQLKENPGLENRMYNIEKHTRTFIAYKKGGNGGGDKGGKVIAQGTPEKVAATKASFTGQYLKDMLG